MKNKNTEKIEFLKIVYFDEAAAQDYVDVTNGGRLDWSTQENKEKIAKIVAEIEAQAKSGFNILKMCIRDRRIPGLRFYRLPRRSKERPADRAREARAECARYRP